MKSKNWKLLVAVGGVLLASPVMAAYDLPTNVSGITSTNYVNRNLNTKQDKLTAGDNITIAADGTISAAATDLSDYETAAQAEAKYADIATETVASDAAAAAAANATEIAKKQDKIVAGSNISIAEDGKTISASIDLSAYETAETAEGKYAGIATEGVASDAAAAAATNAGAITALGTRVTTAEGKITANETAIGTLKTDADAALSAAEAADGKAVAAQNTANAKIDKVTGQTGKVAIFKADGNVEATAAALGTAAFTDSTAYATAQQGAKADAAAVKADVDAALLLKANSADVYTKTATDTLLEGKAAVGASYTKAESDAALLLKADKATTYTKTEVDTALTGKEDIANRTSDLATDAASTTKYTTAKGVVDYVGTAVSGKADASTVSALDTRVTTNASNIEDLNDALEGKQNQIGGGTAGTVITNTGTAGTVGSVTLGALATKSTVATTDIADDAVTADKLAIPAECAGGDCVLTIINGTMTWEVVAR